MQTYILEFSGGPDSHREDGPASTAPFERLDASVREAALEVEPRLRVESVGTPFRYLEVIDGEPDAANDYARLVKDTFEGPVRMRTAQELDASPDSAPSVSAPHKSSSAKPPIGLPRLEPFPPGCCP